MSDRFREVLLDITSCGKFFKVRGGLLESFQKEVGEIVCLLKSWIFFSN